MDNLKCNTFTIGKISYPEFKDFIDLVSEDFTPPFLSYVDLESYYEKVSNLAEFSICRCGDELVGLVVFYQNNHEIREGYIPFVAVKKEFRGLHIASNLMLQAFSTAKKNGMINMTIRTNNIHALKCYLGLGFKVVKEIFEEENNLTRYYLNIEL